MIETLVRGGPDPISADLMAVFPMVANLTIATDDSAIMQVIISAYPALESVLKSIDRCCRETVCKQIYYESISLEYVLEDWCLHRYIVPVDIKRCKIGKPRKVFILQLYPLPPPLHTKHMLNMVSWINELMLLDQYDQTWCCRSVVDLL